MGLLFAKKDHNYGRTSAWSHKSTSRSTEQKIQGLQQLETQSQDILWDCDLNGTDRNRSVYRQNERPDFQICELEAWFRSLEDYRKLPWSQLQAYAFPPFCLIGRALAKVWQDQATLILVTPAWQTRPPWYVELLEMSIADPILLPPLPDLLASPMGQAHPLINQGLRLPTWKVSGSTQLQKDFQMQLKSCSVIPEETAPNLHMNPME